ncbi:MAG: alpha/beta hydrolase [Candidatus Marinimicrobia bacterium]|nr:alpha/beta hydrolase [Candidatus Neomarinimicrobiota bacterium]MCF7829661.1 alpha/beta hydrolase [Candidatus Neomarinimicrobiota bacterium]MCF7879821.1 alpha/beta hydrolase [Candidatus Neomarinimicrobiota bacterium]
MPYIELPHYRLHYQQYGSGPALVFLHGLTFDSRMWQAQYDVFRDENLVLGLDFRGHGYSDAPEEPYTLDTYIGDVSALLNALHLPNAILVGLSLGGAVALEFAARYPQRVSGLALASPALAGYEWSRAWKETMNRIQQAGNLRTLRQNLRQYWLNDPMFAKVRTMREHAALLRKMATSFSGMPLLHGNMQIKSRDNVSDRLRKIRCPVSVVTGQGDRSDFRSIAKTLASKLERVEWHQLDDAGHMVNMEKSQHFNSLLRQFLYRVDAGGF